MTDGTIDLLKICLLADIADVLIAEADTTEQKKFAIDVPLTRLPYFTRNV